MSNTTTEDRIKAVDILEVDYELRLVIPADIKIAGAGRSQKRSYVDDERSLSRVSDFENAYTDKRDVPPMILEEITGVANNKTLYMVDGNHRLKAIKNLNGSAPTEIPAYVITRTLSEHERAALTCQANSGGPLSMLEAEINQHIADSLNEGISIDNIVKHYPNVTRQRVLLIQRASTTAKMLDDLKVPRLIKANLAGTKVTATIRKIYTNQDHETASRLNDGIRQLNSGKLSQNEFCDVFNRCGIFDAAKRPKALADLDETLRAAERPKNKNRATSSASVETMKRDVKRFLNRSDDELARLVTDTQGRRDVDSLVNKLGAALEVTNA